MSKATVRAIKPVENPYLSGLDVSDLLHNVRARPPGESHFWVQDGQYSREQLDAIRQQAENLKDRAHYNLKSLGAIVAVAAASGEAVETDLMNMGHLTEFLAEWVMTCDALEANSRHKLTE
jgi:hypothetical protein